MNTYYCVYQMYYDNGTVDVGIDEIHDDVKPAPLVEEKEKYDMYCDFFDTREEAERFLSECRCA